MGTERTQTDVELEAVDRALKEALSVDPSPEFLARIRTRIAAEPSPSRRWISPVALVAAVAAVLLIIVVASTSKRSPAPAVITTATQSIPSAAQKEAVTSSPSPVQAVERTAVERRVGPRREQRTSVIEPDERHALRELLQAVDRGTVTVAVRASAEERSTSMSDVAIAPITIPSIVMDPITPVAGELR